MEAGEVPGERGDFAVAEALHVDEVARTFHRCRVATLVRVDGVLADEFDIRLVEPSQFGRQRVDRVSVYFAVRIKAPDLEG